MKSASEWRTAPLSLFGTNYHQILAMRADGFFPERLFGYPQERPEGVQMEYMTGRGEVLPHSEIVAWRPFTTADRVEMARWHEEMAVLQTRG